MITAEQKENIGIRLKAERIRLGLTQKGLAELLGSSRLIVLGYEAGKSLPGTEMLLALKAAGVDIQFVLSGESPSPVMEQRDLFERAFVEVARQAEAHRITQSISDHLNKAWAIVDALQAESSLMGNLG
jgi:transcriptional regulator with XRE-family HTH domain